MTDGASLSPESLAELERLGHTFKGADKLVQKGLRAGLRAAVKPLTEEIVREGAAGLPARGGLRARVAASRGGLRTDLFGGRSIRLILAFTDRQKDSLKGLDEGLLRHPVFGHWVAGVPAQKVPAHRFSDAYKRRAPLIRDRVRLELERTAHELARKA